MIQPLLLACSDDQHFAFPRGGSVLPLYFNTQSRHRRRAPINIPLPIIIPTEPQGVHQVTRSESGTATALGLVIDDGIAIGLDTVAVFAETAPPYTYPPPPPYTADE